MASIELAPEIVEDFDRILFHLAQHEFSDASARITEIVRAIEVLAHNPLIGRPVSKGKRELVIGRTSHGYVALYRYLDEIDAVFVLALQSA
jgi:toxin ParE1/3/4